MGHYDDQYEAHDRARATRRIKEAAKEYAEVVEHLDALASFVNGWKRKERPEMKQAYKLLQGTIDTWRMNEGLLVSNPKILLDKLKDD